MIASQRNNIKSAGINLVRIISEHYPDCVLCRNQENPRWQQMGFCSLNAVLVLAALCLLLRAGLLLRLV